MERGRGGGEERGEGREGGRRMEEGRREGGGRGRVANELTQSQSLTDN